MSDYWLASTELVDEIAEQFLRQTVRKLRIAPPRNKIFTQFTLDRQSISDKQETLCWRDIEELTIEEARIVVLKRRIDEPASEREAGNDL